VATVCAYLAELTKRASPEELAQRAGGREIAAKRGLHLLGKRLALLAGPIGSGSRRGVAMCF
jgi:hypothetical protein